MTVALVTGANRGIGQEVAVQLGALGHHVVVTARDPGSAAATERRVRDAGGRAIVVELDVAQLESVAAAAARVAADVGRLDVLVNNAAIDYDSGQTAIDADLDAVRRTLETNLFGAWRTTQAFVPLLRRSASGRIVNVSSGAATLADMAGRVPAYKVSKVALNALTRMWAAELADDGILVNSVCPGWVATDLGGGGGRPVGDGAAGVVWAATLPAGGPTGGFFRDREPVPW